MAIIEELRTYYPISPLGASFPGENPKQLPQQTQTATKTTRCVATEEATPISLLPLVLR